MVRIEQPSVSAETICTWVSKRRMFVGAYRIKVGVNDTERANKALV
jgi:hypothetical protein